MFLAVSVLALFALVGSLMLASYLSELRARQHLLVAVSQSSSVAINGQELSDPSRVLSALRGITQVPGHHSSPTAPIHLELRGSPEVVAITIARDSQNPSEFWVYRPGSNWHNDPLGQQAGSIVNAELNTFLQSRGL